MSVSITFEPSGINGLVAEGTYLVDAARRMGVSLGTGCARGKTPCPSCLVVVSSGSEILSSRSEVERRLLENGQLDDSFRLACQVKIQNPGELVVRVSEHVLHEKAQPASSSDLPKRFSELPLDKKISTLLQLEAIAMTEAMDAMIQKPIALGAKALDAVGRFTSREKRDSSQPVEK